MGRRKSAAEVFDALGERYEEVFGQVPGQIEALDWLTARLPAGARVLDVGSGTGRPTAETLVRAGCDVTGIDVSAAMVALARARVPGARFEQADVRTYTPPPGGFDAVCSFFPLLVMDQPEVAAALDRMASWTAPGGYFVMATVPGDIRGLDIEWMGHEVTVSSLSTEDHLARLADRGLEVLHHHTATFRPADGGAVPEEHLFCYARRMP
ncbi:methyltransferase domain-containing protein [Streptomyces virginiae]|uniref:class I SAM-dependent methyltransferase n=1 Tax=Streptomyces TaxID=1883 RepID=UPI0006AE9F06|nr:MULTISPECIES: class I SAM-dependent methyltransferase [unclassified Streptomyces]KOU75453.1 methyltransferase [Streptomyces sp. IGB124]KOU86325.1 methyltransferase [Streptomyces sp. XY58]KOV06028.1 methyltransferase [Streptomyces sp. XY37]KOV48377.1 methyltransferase [Streptomyces sp. MMG1064]